MGVIDRKTKEELTSNMQNRVKTNLNGTSIEKFLAMTEAYSKSLSNELFHNIVPGVASVLPKIESLKTLQAAVKEGNHKAVMQRNDLRKEITSDMSRMCEWVNIYSHGDKKILDQCGFEPCKQRSAAPLPQSIKKLVVHRSTEAGKALIVWKGNGSKFYRTQMTIDPTQNETWKDVATVTSNRFEMSGLPVGRFCYFRVQGVNATGAGDYSDVYVYMAS